jgi:proline iminopeptidase
MTALDAGEYIASVQPNARLVVFEESGHTPFVEEPERFRDEVAGFIADL